MPLEQRLSLPVLAELSLTALEDTVDDLALDHPGVVPALRSGHSLRERKAHVSRRIDSLSTAMRPRQLLMRLETTRNKIDNLDAPQGFPQLWEAFIDLLNQLDDAENASATEPAIGFRMSPSDGGPAAIMLRFFGGTPDVQTSRSGSRLDPSDPSAFVAAVTALCAEYRRKRRLRFTPADRLALLRAYQLVEAGVRPAPPMTPLRTDLWRPTQTYLAVADPGRSHLRHTVRHSDLLDGAIVHVETIDRGGIANRGQIEAYRIPSIRDVARIRVHVGDEAPCSVYVGRPVFEGWTRTASTKPTDANGGQSPAAADSSKLFEQSLLKASHTIAAACSGLFSLGVAECKIGLDGLSARQAVTFMKALVGNVIRDRSRQRLSAAFNINTPLLDDRDESRPAITIIEPFQVAKLAITLAHRGEFEKVTWDGAGDGPSMPFLHQLKPAETLKLVHAAHECGLETYISAGMTADHMPPAAQVGVGGVGIGILLHKKNEVGAITHRLPEQIRETLQSRSYAAKTVAGRAAAALAQLDWHAFQSPLDEAQESQRQELYTALLNYHEQGTAPAAHLKYEVELLRVLEPLEQYLTQLREEVNTPVRHRGGASLIASGYDDDNPLFDMSADADEIPAETGRVTPPAPIIAVAEGQIRRAIHEKRGDDALKLRAMVECGDDEGLKYYLGYQ